MHGLRSWVLLHRLRSACRQLVCALQFRHLLDRLGRHRGGNLPRLRSWDLLHRLWCHNGRHVLAMRGRILLYGHGCADRCYVCSL